MLRAGTEWCSLCYADLRPREESATPSPAILDVGPAPEPTASAPALPDLVAPAPSAAAVQPAAPGGKHAKHARQPEFGAVTAPSDEVERLAAQLMAELAATEGGSPLGAASTVMLDSVRSAMRQRLLEPQVTAARPPRPSPG